MRSDPQNMRRDAYRYISSYNNVGVFYADTGIVDVHIIAPESEPVLLGLL